MLYIEYMYTELLLVSVEEKELKVLEIGGLIETTQSTALLRSVRILRRVLET